MTMMGRFVEHGIRILAAVALLAVMSSPIRPAGTSHTAPSPNYIPRYFAMLSMAHDGQFVVMARPSMREADSLQSDIEDELAADIEDELTAKSSPASVSFAELPSPCPEPHSERVSFAVAMAARPLRC
jgi:hypothetical protein